MRKSVLKFPRSFFKERRRNSLLTKTLPFFVIYSVYCDDNQEDRCSVWNSMYLHIIPLIWGTNDTFKLRCVQMKSFFGKIWTIGTFCLIFRKK